MNLEIDGFSFSGNTMHCKALVALQRMGINKNY
jgi:hypothetical protein